VAIPTGAEEMRQLLERAQGSDTSTLPVLQKMLQDPAMVDRLGGDLAWQAEIWFIDAIAGNNLSWREAIVRKMELLRADLSGPNPTPVERLLVERIVGCWLQVQHANICYARAKELSFAGGDYYQRWIDRAHRRYLAAIKTLAVVRKLAIPVLQVNIARRQVNAAGAVRGER
jgi:hypothetical protein